MTPRTLTPLIAAIIVATAFAGCADQGGPAKDANTDSATSYKDMGFDGTTWPDLHGAKVTILDHGAFDYAFGPAKAAFENLTNGTVEHIAADDAGSALQRAMREKGRPSFDVIYGIDNVLMKKAIDEGVFEPYKPTLADRVPSQYAFVPDWHATPVDHGYIGVNVDPRANLSITTLDDVRAHADSFVTEDPRTSTPGLGFLVSTVATYGEDGDYTWKNYWMDLFDGGVLVTAGWTEAYVQHFTGGYGRWEEGFAGERAIVTSYTTSPAYELFYESDVENLNVLAPKATFHQIQTMGIAKGTKNLAAAQAWIEFTLTDAFQGLAAEYNAIYPVVDGVDVSGVYGGKDPAPGSFEDAGYTYAQLGSNVERWITEWVDLYERHRS